MLFGVSAPSVQGASCGGREASRVAVSPTAASRISTSRIEVWVYVSCFRYWLDGSSFLTMNLEGARHHVLI